MKTRGFSCGCVLSWLILLLYPPCLPATQVADTVLIFPFKDHSYFPGSWDIVEGIPRLLGEILHQNKGFVVLPIDTIAVFLAEGEDKNELSEIQALRIGTAAGADLVLTGDIRTFAINRFSTGNPLIGGYTAYTAKIKVETQLLRTLSGIRLGAAEEKAEMTDRNLGLTLLGKPTQKEATLAELNHVPFGDERFQASIIGKVCLEALQKIAGELGRLTKPYAIQQTKPKVLSLEGNQVFINLGVADRVAVGHKFAVFTRQDSLKIGLIQVVEVIARHLSKARVLEGLGVVKAGAVLGIP